MKKKAFLLPWKQTMRGKQEAMYSQNTIAVKNGQSQASEG